MTDTLLNAGTLLPLVFFVVPGFIAWKVVQSRQPQGQQKTADAIVEIVVYGVINGIICSIWIPPQRWKTWPANPHDVASFAVEIVLVPLLMAWVVSWLFGLAAERGVVLWPHPRAWDWIFNKLARENKAFAVIITLHDGRKVAGVYKRPGFASIYPYSRDLFLGEIWSLDTAGRFESRIRGAVGVYVDQKDVLTIELFEYTGIMEDAIGRASELTEGQNA